MASNTGAKSGSPSRYFFSTSMKSVVPSRSMRPPRPLLSLSSSAMVCLPLKQSRMRSPTGSEPDRWGENGPSPSRALLTSLKRPLRCAPTEMPPPMWQTITLTRS